jgi:hypothetical protein
MFPRLEPFHRLLLLVIILGEMSEMGAESAVADNDGEAGVVVFVAAASWVHSISHGPSVKPSAAAHSSGDNELNHCRTFCWCVGGASFFEERTVEPVVASAPFTGDWTPWVVVDVLADSVVASLSIIILVSFSKLLLNGIVYGKVLSGKENNSWSLRILNTPLGHRQTFTAITRLSSFPFTSDSNNQRRKAAATAPACSFGNACSVDSTLRQHRKAVEWWMVAVTTHSLLRQQNKWCGRVMMKEHAMKKERDISRACECIQARVERVNKN